MFLGKIINTYIYNSDGGYYIIMKYMGSKNRIAKDILPFLYDLIGGTDRERVFYDVFCGGGNLIDKVNPSLVKKRVAVDNNEYVIEALKMIRDRPKDLPFDSNKFNKYDYKYAKWYKDKGKKGYVGFALSYGGKWFGGFRKDKEGRRDYVREAYDSAIRQSSLIQDVEFICASYDQVDYEPNSIIYCDPPYKDTTNYKNTSSFDHDKFWQWVRANHSEDRKIFVSEYTAPDDFQCLWSKPITSSLTKDTGSKIGIEKLFILK